MKKFAIASMLLLLAGCKLSLNGQMTVTEETTLKHNGEVLKVFTPGEFETEIEIRRTRVKITTIDGEKSEVEFTTNERVELPKNGEFYLSTEQTGLNHAIAGEITTVHEQIDRWLEWETCSVYRGPNMPNSGHQQVEVVLYDNQRAVEMDFVETGMSFNSDERWQSTLRNRIGPCF